VAFAAGREETHEPITIGRLAMEKRRNARLVARKLIGSIYLTWGCGGRAGVIFT
jgi:hypothetical protein